MPNNKSIIYVNYFPYENAGKILDFLLENYEYVFLFSLGFHQIKKGGNYNKLSIYRNSQLISEHSLNQLPVPQQLVFVLLPLKSVITFIQILIYTFWIKTKYGKVDIYFTANAFTAWIGNMLKSFGLVGKTVFWVWDYYPPIHKNKIITLMRQIYWQFDRISSFSDKVVYVNQKLMDLRKDMGVIPENASYPIVPIGTEKNSNLKINDRKILKFGFIGVVKKGQGLDVIFDNAQIIIDKFPDSTLEVIGSGPDLEYFKNRAKNSPLPTKFYGYTDADLSKDILNKCMIGLATYIPDPSNVSHYGDPGKVKIYLSLGLPVITTDIFEFAKTVSKNKAGIIIDVTKPDTLTNAINEIKQNYKIYSTNALKLSDVYNFRKIYPEMFNFTDKNQ